MSTWSNCDAILSVYTYINIPDFERVIKQMLDGAPKITGSEGDCNVVAIDFFAGTSVSYDCQRCSLFNIYHKNIHKYSNEKRGCPGFMDATKNQLKKCKDGQFIDSGDYIDRCRLIITCKHGLRDKSKEETLREFKELLNYIRNYKNKIFKVEVICKNIN